MTTEDTRPVGELVEKPTEQHDQNRPTEVFSDRPAGQALQPEEFAWKSEAGATVRRMLVDWAYLRASGGVPEFSAGGGGGSASATPGYISAQRMRAMDVQRVLEKYGAPELVGLLAWMYSPQWCDWTVMVEYELADGTRVTHPEGAKEPPQARSRQYIYTDPRWRRPNLDHWSGPTPGAGYWPMTKAVRAGLLRRAVSDFAAFLAQQIGAIR